MVSFYFSEKNVGSYKQHRKKGQRGIAEPDQVRAQMCAKSMLGAGLVARAECREKEQVKGD